VSRILAGLKEAFPAIIPHEAPYVTEEQLCRFHTEKHVNRVGSNLQWEKVVVVVVVLIS